MTRIVGPPGSRRRRRFLVGPVLLAMFVGLVFIGGALAVHNEGLFELDKNIVDDNTTNDEDDWFNINNDTDHAFNDTGIVPDPGGQNDPIFTGGGSKDYLDIDTGPWKHKTGNVPPKDDITNAYAAGYTNSDDDIIISFGMDRFATEGSANVGFWFFQDDVAPVSGGTFTGEHVGSLGPPRVPGDLLVLSEFDEGGTGVTIKVFEWVGTGGDEGGGTLRTLFGGASGLPADCVGGVPADDDVCATVNTSTITNGGTPDRIPWAYVGKSNTPDMAPGVFFEGGINLTEMFDDPSTPGDDTPCISNFLAETRSSFEVNAVLKDFVHSSFPLCGEKSGVKFNDKNTDGDQDTDEEGLEGWTINLYEDTGTKGVLDGEAVSDTATTDADGAYSFEQLAFGDYIVCEGLQATWNQSAPTSAPPGETLADCPGSTKGYAFTMSGPSLEDNDFGNFQRGALRIIKNSTKTDQRVKTAGAVFSYQGPSAPAPGSSVTDDTTAAAPDEDADIGEVCVSGLLPGQYSVDETAAPPGYGGDPGGAQTVTVVGGTDCGTGRPTVAAALRSRSPPLHDA
jgi:hypothetical protein